VNRKNIAGFSLIEVMISCLMFAIIMLGFIGYLIAIVNQYHYFNQQFQAEKIAFALLDSYPDKTQQIIPNNWQYQVYSQPYGRSCQMVFVSVTPIHHKTIKQQRFLCD
jgi:Tfp pilus assembly protein PilV